MAEARDTAARLLAAFNAHDQVAMSALNAPNVKFEAPGGVKLEGRDASTGYAKGWLTGFPDAKMIVHSEIVASPWVIQECTFEGTQTGPLTGPLGTIQPTGKKVVGKCVQIGRYENGLATEFRLYYDQVEILSQLGVMPVPVATV